MYLPVEVARLAEHERRQATERRIRWLAIIREQREQARAAREQARAAREQAREDGRPVAPPGPRTDSRPATQTGSRI